MVAISVKHARRRSRASKRRYSKLSRASRWVRPLSRALKSILFTSEKKNASDYCSPRRRLGLLRQAAITPDCRGLLIFLYTAYIFKWTARRFNLIGKKRDVTISRRDLQYSLMVGV
ncbi:hypothetical protein PUN28_005267 [Cardiocondyla obscurior]|uniref:Uncharacterized protein n=1 Tax=Cardiocondyla obscurior TaxID=286306 RepID=A0AAW2GI40_9HYME